MRYIDIHRNGKQYRGHANKAASISQPAMNETRTTPHVGATIGPLAIRCVHENVPTSSAVPNTAGITVEKLSEQSRKY
jgi:hypothetical protein